MWEGFSALTTHRGRKMSIVFSCCPGCSSHAKPSMTVPSRSSGNKIQSSGLIHLLRPSSRLLSVPSLEQKRRPADSKEGRIGTGLARYVHVRNLTEGSLNALRNWWRLTGGAGPRCPLVFEYWAGVNSYYSSGCFVPAVGWNSDSSHSKCCGSAASDS